MRFSFVPKIVFAMAAMAAIPTTAHASADAPTRAPEQIALERCLDGGALNNAQFQQCYGTAITQAEERLNTRWGQLLTRLAPSPETDADQARRLAEFATQHRDALISEQALWTAFRAKACNLYWDEGLGSMHRSIVGPQCIFNVIEQRIVQIDDYLENFETE